MVSLATLWLALSGLRRAFSDDDAFHYTCCQPSMPTVSTATTRHVATTSFFFMKVQRLVRALFLLIEVYLYNDHNPALIHDLVDRAHRVCLVPLRGESAL